MLFALTAKAGLETVLCFADPRRGLAALVVKRSGFGIMAKAIGCV
jgi:hypothetical protein